MIKNIELLNYDRFFLNNISKIDYSPLSKLQLVLGSNGSGKSSLLAQLNPLPINKNDFREKGYKTITIEKDNNTYVLHSTLQKNSFKCNDVELNVGGTKKVQLALIREYFLLTPKYNNIVLSVDTLTNMSSNDRKQILREMSTVDYSYSIYLYNTLKQQHRDITGYLKLIYSEMESDSNSMLNEDEILVLKEDIVKLKELIDGLSREYQKYEHTVAIDVMNMSNYKKLLSDGIATLNLDKLKLDAELCKKYINESKEEIDRINQEIDTLDKYTIANSETEHLKKEISKYDLYFQDLEDIPIDKTDNEKLYNNFIAKENSLLTIITELSYLDEIQFTQTEHIEIAKELESILNKLNIYKSNLVNYTSELDMLNSNKKDDNKITCKKCGDISYFGYDGDRVTVLTKEVSRFEELVNKTNKNYNSLLEKYEKQKSKIKLLSLLKNEYSELNLLAVFNKYLTLSKESILNTSSTFHNIILSKISYLVESYRYYNVKLKEYNDLAYKLKLDIEVINIYRAKNKEDKEKLVAKIENLQDKRRVYQERLNTINSDIEKYLKYQDMRTKIEKDYEQHKKNRTNIIKKNKNDIINKSISELKDLLITLEEKYNNYEKVKYRIQVNNNLIANYIDERDALAMAIKALSPTEGLIAKSINSFINVFLNEMNSIINSVWSYDVTLLPCQVNEQDDLDYMFAVNVDGKKDIADVSMLSTSMKDIVNLSFKIIFMKYMNLTYMPLILDEFGVTMDDLHRDKVYHVLENILSNNFSQIFFTANFKSIYGRFVDSEIVILDDKNLEIDNMSYNTNIKMEYDV